jgi:Coenzyme PQQ synthesis protein D (PqqD)
MTFPNEYRPQRLQSDKLILEQLPEELMIYDPERNKAFCLNQSAAFVWQHADGEKTISQLAALLGADQQRQVDEQVVWFALDILAKDGLLAASNTLPAVSAGVTRRDLLQRVGASAAMALPLVTVLFVNPAKAHASSKEPPPPDPSEPVGPVAAGPKHNEGFWAWLENLF